MSASVVEFPNKDVEIFNWFVVNDSRQYVAYLIVNAFLLFTYFLLCIKVIRVLKSKSVKKHER